jgi:hypothetical protein
MSALALTFHYPKARKIHSCAVCGCAIPKGVVHHYQTYAYDGTVDSWRAHSDCAEMHWHHNKGRESDDQAGDYLRNGYRGFWPHAICRIELRNEIRRIKREART